MLSENLGASAPGIFAFLGGVDPAGETTPNRGLPEIVSQGFCHCVKLFAFSHCSAIGF